MSGPSNRGLSMKFVRTPAAPARRIGFVPPSLLSLFAFPQTFFHNGAAHLLEKCWITSPTDLPVAVV